MKFSKLALFTVLALSAGSAQATDINTSGFFVGGISGSDGEHDISRNTKIGVQIDAKITDKVFGTFQVVNRENLADPEIGRETAIEYGFIGYKATDDINVRAGRLRLPFFMLSEYVEVGNVIPWIEAPQSVYRQLPTNAYDGIDASYNGSLGDVSYVANGFAGNGVAPANVGGVAVDVEMEQAKGANITLNYDEWNFRLSYGESNVSFQADDLTKLGMQQSFDTLTAGVTQLSQLAMQATDPSEAQSLLQQAQALGQQAGQLGFLIQELPAARKIAIINAGVHGYITDNLSVLAEYSGFESDNMVVNDSSGFYVATTYSLDEYMLTATYSTQESTTLNNSTNQEQDEYIFTVARELGGNWLAKAEVAQQETTINGIQTEDFTRWGVTINYVF